MRHLKLGALLLCVAIAPAALAQTTIGTFSGGDAGEGLDLDGSFTYAVNARGPAVGMVRDADFTDDSAPGVVINAQNEILTWNSPNLGASAADDAMETVLQSIRWSGSPTPVTVQLSGVQPGATYQLQLFFTEECCARGFDVFVEGDLIADEFSPNLYVAASGSPTAGVVITHTFVADGTTVDITLDGASASFQDTNPTISGLTLEFLAAAEALPADVPALDARALALLGVLLAAAAVIVLRRV
jgi:hypothetical protein